MSENLIVKNNAKKEEYKAYYYLKDFVFLNKKTVIGDDISKFKPDIYTEDLKIGVEVTSCEHISQFLKETKLKKNNVIAKSLIEDYDKLSLKDKNLLFLNEFEKVLEKKIKKIPNYKSCEKLYLIIVSDNENKKFIRREVLTDIYKKLTIKHNKKYENLFLFYNNTLYVENNYEFKKLKKFKNEELTF